MKSSIFYIEENEYIEKKKRLGPQDESLFDFLYTTGARISEAMMIEARSINPEEKIVNIPTLKNPSKPIRQTRFVPYKPEFISSIQTIMDLIPNGKLWAREGQLEPRKYAWRKCHQTFQCTTHSFRHTHATNLVKDYGANLYELMQQMGWSEPKPALIYVQYEFGKTLDQKINEYYAKKGKI